MNKSILFFIPFLFSVSIQAQLLDSRLWLHLGYGISDFLGSELLDSEGFIYPSLYANYKADQTYFLKAEYGLGTIYALSMTLNHTRGIEWSYPEYNIYEGSSVRLFSISPAVQIHTPFKDEGWLNRIKLYAEAGPSVGISIFQSPNPMIQTDPSSESMEITESSTDFMIGLNTNAGVNISLSQSLGFFLSCSYSFFWIDSFLYIDTINQRLGINTGIIFKFSYDKHFYR